MEIVVSDPRQWKRPIWAYPSAVLEWGGKLNSEWHRLNVFFALPLTHSLSLAGYKPFFAFQQPITASAKVMSECGFSPENP